MTTRPSLKSVPPPPCSRTLLWRISGFTFSINSKTTFSINFGLGFCGIKIAPYIGIERARGSTAAPSRGGGMGVQRVVGWPPSFGAVMCYPFSTAVAFVGGSGSRFSFLAICCSSFTMLTEMFLTFILPGASPFAACGTV